MSSNMSSKMYNNIYLASVFMYATNIIGDLGSTYIAYLLFDSFHENNPLLRYWFTEIGVLETILSVAVITAILITVLITTCIKLEQFIGGSEALRKIMYYVIVAYGLIGLAVTIRNIHLIITHAL